MQAAQGSGSAPARRGPTSEDLLALLDALPANVALWDADVRLRYANRRQLTRFGGPQHARAGTRLTDLVQPHAVELSARYIDGALAGRLQQVERAMVDRLGQRYNAHQVTHVPNVVDGDVTGYCALAVDITSSLEGFEQQRRLREQAALASERERIAGDLGEHRVMDDLTGALRRLDDAIARASDAVPSLGSAADAIERTIEELRATVPNHLAGEPAGDDAVVAFPAVSPPFTPGATDHELPPGVRWPAEVGGAGWTVTDLHRLLDLVPAALAVWDVSLVNEYANRTALRWLGRDVGAAPGDALAGVGAGDIPGAEVLAEAGPAVRAALAGQPQQVERTIVHPTGLRHVQAFYLPRVRNASIDGLYTFVVDVTARVEAELALREARAARAAARERQRIADELHNMVIQRLFAAGLAANLATEVTPARLRSVQDGISAALADLEAALGALPEPAGAPDLLPALARLVGAEAEPHGIAAAIENVGSVDYVPRTLAAEVLAAAREALADAVRRPGARSITVTIAADADEVRLRVAGGSGEPVFDWRAPVA